MKKMHQAIYEFLKDKKSGYLLDAACGKGELGGALEKAGHQVFCMDKYANPRNIQRLVKADLNDFLPYKDKQFDFVVCAESLQYLENHEKLFREFRRILKTGGSLIISFPNILTIFSRLYFLRRGYFQHFKPFRTKQRKEWDHFIYNIPSFVEVFQLLKKNSFELRDVISVDIKLKDLLLYPFIRALYLPGLIFDKNKNMEKTEMLKRLASRELLTGSRLVISCVKVNDL
ncbi:MAG: class I SAM-dependent methyltransferase [Nitrospirae bacterium]|nr:class I SAM-dependent methyltransferase [Nitrospirota bacterium]